MNGYTDIYTYADSFIYNRQYFKVLYGDGPLERTEAFAAMTKE